MSESTASQPAADKSSDTQTLEEFASREYEWGFVTDIEADSAPPGLNEEIIRFISAKKEEPEFMLEWRLGLPAVAENGRSDASCAERALGEGELSRYRLPKCRLLLGAQEKELSSLDEVDPELLETHEKARYTTRRAKDARWCSRGRRL